MTNDYVSGIWFPDCSKLARNCSVNDFIVCRYEGIIKVFDTFFLFLLTILVTGPSFMSISWLVLELQKFPFIRDWLEIWKSEISSSQFWAISRDGQIRDTKFGTNVANKMLLNAVKFQGCSFNCFWQGVKLPPTQIRVKVFKTSSGFNGFKASICFIPWSSIIIACFLKAFIKVECAY